MSLPQALDIALKLKSALASEVTRSQESRSVLKQLDAQALLSQATLREAFNQRSAQLSAELGQAIAAYALAQGRDDITLEQIEQLAPFEGAQLAGVFAEIRALSRALKELDEVNQQIAERALTVVRAYVNHLAPRPNAYTRRGAAVAFEARTHSEHA